MVITLSPNNIKSKRCKKCRHYVDCIMGEVCFLDQKRLNKLNKILHEIAVEWRDRVYYTRPRVLHIRELVAFYGFELHFTGSRNQRRASARYFITKYGRLTSSEWEFSRSNNKPVFRLRY